MPHPSAARRHPALDRPAFGLRCVVHDAAAVFGVLFLVLGLPLPADGFVSLLTFVAALAFAAFVGSAGGWGRVAVSCCPILVAPRAASAAGWFTGCLSGFLAGPAPIRRGGRDA